MLLLLKLYVNLGRSMDKPIGIKGEFSTLKIDPNRDLRKEIELYCKGRYVKLGTVFNAFGTLAKARLGSSRNTTSLELNDPVELLSSSGIVREENGQLDTNVNIIVSKNGKARAGYSIMVRGTNAGHLGSFSLVDILSHGRACAVLNPYYTIGEPGREKTRRSRRKSHDKVLEKHRVPNNVKRGGRNRRSHQEDAGGSQGSTAQNETAKYAYAHGRCGRRHRKADETDTLLRLYRKHRSHSISYLMSF